MVPMTGDPRGILNGGSPNWQMPSDGTCARQCRSLLHATMTALRLPADLIDAGVLAVSELASNCSQHCQPYDLAVPPELWIWSRNDPAPQLVVAVFDTCRGRWPDRNRHADLLDERGKGLGLVDAVTDQWGAHLTRSRLGSLRAPGKTVW